MKYQTLKIAAALALCGLALTLITGCAISDETTAQIVSRTAIQGGTGYASAQALNAVLPKALADMESKFIFSDTKTGSISNEKGGTAEYILYISIDSSTMTSSFKMSLTYSDWHVEMENEDGELEVYELSGTMDIDLPTITFDFTDDTGSMTMTYGISGDISVEQDYKTNSAQIDLQTIYTCSFTATTYTVSGTTTGTVGGTSVNETFEFAYDSTEISTN